jgi:uncharacterized protein involved in copper resistance
MWSFFLTRGRRTALLIVVHVLASITLLSGVGADSLRHLRQHGHDHKHHKTPSSSSSSSSSSPDLKAAALAVKEHRDNYDGGGTSVVDLRHADLKQWKAKKKELRQQQKTLTAAYGSGYTKKLGSGPAGTSKFTSVPSP